MPGAALARLDNRPVLLAHRGTPCPVTTWKWGVAAQGRHQASAERRLASLCQEVVPQSGGTILAMIPGKLQGSGRTTPRVTRLQSSRVWATTAANHWGCLWS